MRKIEVRESQMSCPRSHSKLETTRIKTQDQNRFFSRIYFIVHQQLQVVDFIFPEEGKL